MSLDAKGLGRLQRVADPREVWLSEAGDFTPWLADNIDLLADELGLTLTLVATEVWVGSFRLDIQAEDGQGLPVVIENQLERTDHSHLGQALVYASGLEAGTMIWVSPVFREEFRRALDWLNERTDDKIGFFGVEVGVVQIEGGPRAPVFNVVARPNGFQKSAKSGVGAEGAGGPLSGPNGARQTFFIDVLTAINARQPEIRIPTPQRTNWLSFASGPFGYWCISQSQRRIRLEAFIDTADHDTNKRLFDEFAADATGWDARTKRQLSWERLDNRRSCRIALYRDVDLDDLADRSEAQQWCVEAFATMYSALNGPLRTKARELRAVVPKEPQETTDALIGPS